MTNKEYLIGLLFAHCQENVDRKTVEVCFEIVNKYDWAVFCSQMGDYDHPGERKQAAEVMEKELYEFTHPFDTDVENYSLGYVAAHVKNSLKGTSDAAARFYHRNFHNMDKEYDAEKEAAAESAGTAGPAGSVH